MGDPQVRNQAENFPIEARQPSGPDQEEKCVIRTGSETKKKNETKTPPGTSAHWRATQRFFLPLRAI
jgi:hypothetical protein